MISTGTQTHYRVSEKREDLLEDVTDTVVHDHWKPYFTMENVKHVLCNPHHLRELKALQEIEKEPWAFEMANFFFLYDVFFLLLFLWNERKHALFCDYLFFF